MLQATYGLAAIPARYALERRQWSTVSALDLPSNLGVESTKFPQMAAINAYARAVGAAKSGDPVAAGYCDLRLAAFHQTLVKAPPPGPYDVAASVESLRLAAAGCRSRRAAIPQRR